MENQKIESNLIKTKNNEEIQETNWDFLNDIESLINESNEKKLRCVVFGIKINNLYQTEDYVFEIGATEIEDFKFTNKTIHMNIKSENQILI